MDDSWRTYEQYTAPLGVGFMVRPGHHYGPDVDGYEYTPWGTYHFADRDGIGVDRTRATGTGFTGQYPPPWSDVYESLETAPTSCCCSSTTCRTGTCCTAGHRHPAHLRHPLRRRRGGGGACGALWDRLGRAGRPGAHARVAERLDEQLRCAGSGATRSTRTSSASPGSPTPRPPDLLISQPAIKAESWLVDRQSRRLARDRAPYRYQGCRVPSSRRFTGSEAAW